MKKKSSLRNTGEKPGQSKKKVADRKLNSKPTQSPKERLEKTELEHNPKRTDEVDTEIYRRQINELAYELYLQRSRHNGNALQDWLAAEQQILGRIGKA